MAPKRTRVALVGRGVDHLATLLADLLRDLGVESEFVDLQAAPGFVVAVVTPESVAWVLGSARLVGVPLIAVLPISDDWLAERCTALGANAVFALDTPLDRLRAIFVQALATAGNGDGRTHITSTGS